MNVHPIEAQSYDVLRRRVDLSHLPPLERAVVERIIHASADLEYADTVVCAAGAAAAGADALAAGAPVVCDVEMVRHGLHLHRGSADSAVCGLDDPRVADLVAAEPGLTRSAAGLRLVADRHREGAVFVIGCAPTALVELVRLATAGVVQPALVIGLPVGFIGAAEAKTDLRASGLPAISNLGEKGGSAVATAACNALLRAPGAPDAPDAPDAGGTAQP